MNDESKLEGEGELLHGIPSHVAREIRQIWRTQVTGGSERYKRSGDRRGVDGQKAVSQAAVDAGILRTDPPWTAIRDFGPSLYYGRTGQKPASRSSSPQAVSTRGVEHHPPSRNCAMTFRERAETHQVWYRKEVLGVGCAAHEHHLDEVAMSAGANFVVPSAHASARARAASGKGVDQSRTFGNMLSSQALGFNIFGPLSATDEGREIAAQVLSHFVPELRRVISISIEHTPQRDVFLDQRVDAGVDADVLIEFETIDAKRGVLIIETNFVEPSFSRCGHRRGNASDCPSDVLIGEDHAGCKYETKNGYLYWARATEHSTLRRTLVTERGCPFGGRLWQPWVNHTLTHVEAARRGAVTAIFAVLAPEANEALDARIAIDELRRELTDGTSARFFPLEEMLLCFGAATLARDEAWRTWASALSDRYDIPESVTSPRPPVTNGHRKTLL